MNDHVSGIRSWFGRARKLDRYFLEEREPFHTKRKFKVRNVQITLSISIMAVVLTVLVLGGNAENQQKDTQAEGAVAQGSLSPVVPARPGVIKSTEGSVALEGAGWTPSGAIGTRSRAFAGSNNARQYGASQIIRPSSGGGTGQGIPMGSSIAVRLSNTLLSSDSAQPVIAEVAEDAIWRGNVLIPTGTRAIGTAGFDDAAKRLQVRFHTFVYPEGDQHPVSAIGLLADGSSGIPGDYHSEATQKQIGKFFGNFVGGLATGMQERQSMGPLGMTLEPGNLRNGLLNGLATSALDEAKSASEGLQNVRPYLTVPGGSTFLLYFEKEYSP